MWIPQFACPECAEIVDASVEVCGCARCGNRYARENDLWRFLTPARATFLEPFIRQYRLVRQRDGRRQTGSGYYKALPWVAADDPHEAEWRIRRETYAHLLRRVLSAAPQSIRILDLGAGNAWLSHRLAELGHRVVAVDALDDDADGLGASKHYSVRFPAIQADYDALPFTPAQFDLVVFNGSLHYAPDPAATIVAAHRMLAPDGAIAVMDSPMFARNRDGDAMVADMAARLESDGSVREFARTGAGYLTFGSLDAVARGIGLRAEFIRSRGSIGWRFRRRLGGIRLGRAPALFGLWMCR
ncbi:MAG TPA: class I SAM-dependent methyltransferase [Vicinamibacterales bacterium]|jgi:SAM-dependent methyltransferase|nr:class I SAM-dependent methyltransferase [Vicinamibacterales bacterium]